MERDLRRQAGWTSIRIRLLDENIPGTCRCYGYRLVETAGQRFRLPRHFGLHWRHIPLLLGLRRWSTP